MTVLVLHANSNAFAAIDPIGAPGVFPSPHEHTFYGAVGVTPTSTAADLLASPTTGRTAGDHAGMWAPTLYVDQRPVRLTKLQVGEYWLAPAGVVVEPPPFGMQYVAGNPHATSEAEASSNVVWHCQQGATGHVHDPRQLSPECTLTNPLKYEVFFPDRWDGIGLTESHFAYSATGKEDVPGFPHKIAQLGLQVDLCDADGRNIGSVLDAAGNVRVSFSSGPWYTAHADFLNGWDEAALAALVNGCLNKVGTCPPHA